MNGLGNCQECGEMRPCACSPTSVSERAELVERARALCAKHDPDKGYQYRDGSRDDYPTMAMAIEALSAGPVIDREDVAECIAAHLGDTYDCTRVWEAWSVGTMTEDDFEPAAERAGEIADAILALLNNQLKAANP